MGTSNINNLVPGEPCTGGTCAWVPEGLHAGRRNAMPAAQDISCQVLVAQELERQRIAADLHDGLGQLLGAAKFRAESALCALARFDVQDARGAMDDVTSTVRQALDEVRRIAMNLRPSTLDDLGILATLSWFLREFQGMYAGIAVSSEFSVEESDVPETLKVPIFRIVQEAMSNVAKHSRAAHARVSLHKADGDLVLAIADDGVGFDPREVAGRTGIGRRMGHSCARERVESSGGRMVLRTAPAAGVSLAISWPIAARATGADNVEAVANHDRGGPHADALRIAGAAGAGSGPQRSR